MIDLELFVAMMDFLAILEGRELPRGRDEAAFAWVRQQELGKEQQEYFLEGVARLWSDWKAEGWESKPRDERLDTLVWTYHRAWVDRYGWEPTNERGIERFHAPPRMR